MVALLIAPPLSRSPLERDHESYSATEVSINGYPSSSNGLLRAQKESITLSVSCVVPVSIFRKEEGQI